MDTDNKQNLDSTTEEKIIDFYLALLASKKGFPQDNKKSFYLNMGIPSFLGNNITSPTTNELTDWLEKKDIHILIKPTNGRWSYTVSNTKEPSPKATGSDYTDYKTAIYDALKCALNSLPSEPLVVNKNNLDNLVIVCDNVDEFISLSNWYKQYVDKDFERPSLVCPHKQKIYICLRYGFRIYWEVINSEKLITVNFNDFYLFVKDRPFTIIPQRTPKEQPTTTNNPRKLMSVDIFKMFLDLMLTTKNKTSNTPTSDTPSITPLMYWGGRMPSSLIAPQPFVIGIDKSKELDKTAFELIFGNTKNGNHLESEIGGEHYINMGMQPIILCGMLDLNGFQFSTLQYLSRRKGNELEELQKAKHMVQLAQEFDKSLIPAKDYFLPSKTLDIISHYQAANNLSNIHFSAICFIVAKHYKNAESRIDDLIINLKNKATL